MSNSFPSILILGSSGMLGRVFFNYLYERYPLRIFGTSRTVLNHPNLLHFNVAIQNTQFEKLKKCEYFINCIGILKGSRNKSEMNYVNSDFPRELELFCKQNNIKLIHISTDAVFSDQSGIVYESTKPAPSDYYGYTKLVGEVKKGINIRTSVLGFDPIEKKGLLEFILKKRGKNLQGYINQKWAGATTLQLAQFVEWIITERKFNNIVRKTNIIHFAPLGPTTKYEIVKVLSWLIFKKKVEKSNGPIQNRILSSMYIETMDLKRYTHSLEVGLKELIQFDLNYVKRFKTN